MNAGEWRHWPCDRCGVTHRVPARASYWVHKHRPRAKTKRWQLLAVFATRPEVREFLESCPPRWTAAGSRVRDHWRKCAHCRRLAEATAILADVDHWCPDCRAAATEA